jgi:hypothetical protein
VAWPRGKCREMIHSDHGPDRIRATEAMEYPGGIPRISRVSAEKRHHLGPYLGFVGELSEVGTAANHPSLCRPQRGDESGYRPAQSGRKGRTMNKICKTDDEKPAKYWSGRRESNPRMQLGKQLTLTFLPVRYFSSLLLKISRVIPIRPAVLWKIILRGLLIRPLAVLVWYSF